MISDKLDRYRIILASRSPRRKELLQGLGIRFEVITRDWDEIYPSDLKAEQIALHVASEKAGSFRADLKENELIITADTIVWCDGGVLDKPLDKHDAFRILRIISGKTHEVITGVCLLSTIRQKTFYSVTKVTFSDMSDE